MDERDEKTLIKLAASGGADAVDAFEELVRRYQDRIYNLIMRNIFDAATAADIAQDVFIQVYKAISSYDQRAQFSTWLYRIAMNAVYSHHRYTSAQKRGGEQRDMSLSHENAPEPTRDARGLGARQRSPDSALIESETNRRVLEAIEELDPEQRQVVTLRDIEGLSYDEIAEVLDVNVGTVRSRLFRGREKLREKLADLVEETET